MFQKSSELRGFESFFKRFKNFERDGNESPLQEVRTGSASVMSSRSEDSDFDIKMIMLLGMAPIKWKVNSSSRTRFKLMK